MVALLLFTPASTQTIGPALHTITGQWNIDSWLAHSLYICSAGMICANAAARLNISQHTFLHGFRQWFARPLTIIVPLLLALLVKSPNADKHHPGLLAAQTDPWLDAYWMISGTYTIFLLMVTTLVLAVLRQDPRSRRTAHLYIAACAAAITASGLRVLAAWTNDHYTPLVATTNCICATILAYAASQSWRQKARATAPL
ncbi:hypothetical protein [Mycobacterium asiaticum]|uniref:Uncharacterized protein n=1 Tax=Mycobacterium asiaticum TaxID=1790 RepID=A0A1A3NK47_MYCAS|nr:hypothetical protein [Mycobacterium asiaticum]OBK22513.1 hypothetical protein A5635_21590 [Mycobacterium asiaticum]